MAGKQVNIEIKTKADLTGANATVKGLQDIETAGKKAGNSTAKSSQRMAYSLGNVGDQVQDVAVQIESGTNALRIFTQQAPQIAGAFGPYGAIGGALLALGALAFKTFSGMGQKGMEVADQLEFMAEATTNVAQIASDFSKQDIDFALKAIKASTDQANLLATAFDNSEKSADNFTTKTLQNMEKVRLAMVKLDELNGKQVDSVDEVKAKEDAAAAARLNQANLDIEAQQRRQELAQLAVTTSQIEFEKTKALAEQQRQKIQDADKLIEKLRQQRDLLKQQGDAELKQDIGTVSASTLLSPVAGGVALYNAFQNKDVRATNNSTIENQLKLLDSQISDLEASIGRGGSISTAVANAAAKVNEAEVSARDIAQSAQTEIESIKQSFNAEEIKAKVSTAAEEAKVVAGEIKSALDTLQPSNEAGKAALEGLKAGVADNQITANESLTTIAQLNALGRSLPVAEREKQATITELMAIMQRYQNDLNTTNREVNALKAQRTLPISR